LQAGCFVQQKVSNSQNSKTSGLHHAFRSLLSQVSGSVSFVPAFTGKLF